ncbi:phage replisome organizer N-terminal domain-containing protein [Virgibacillus dakarensis]|uniref:phage replisome organizer N-terminal domain-containing protein n=1 Tax=Virgibacillus dakarensis TaxID=1917889 RepID=UPI0013562C35|nr:phage replisome organizer N-terminal domain-containing protein [Virgibacillus dakarensis]
MANYEKNKRFYWLQLKEDFFEEDAIDWLEEQPNGKEYSLFYLKLCLKSLRSNGILIRKVGQMLIPYDHKKLAELTKTNSDTVVVAMKLLTKIGLVEILEDGEIYLKQVEEMIGSQSIGAFKKQQQRITRNKLKNGSNLLGGQRVDRCPPDTEKELEKNKDEDKEQHTSEIIQFWNKNGFGLNNIQGKNQLLSWLDDSSFKKPEKIILKAMEIACANNKRRLNYVEGILRNWLNESLLTLEEIEISKKEHKKHPLSNYGYNYGF